jgi:hypothetical protein
MIEVKVGEVTNLYCFYEELLVMGKGVVVDIDTSKKVIAWEVDDVISKASLLEKRIFIKSEDRWIGADVVFRDRNFLSAKLLGTVYEPRLRRSHLRVTTSLTAPVEAEVFKLFSPQNKEKKYQVVDISEGGVGIFLEKRDRFFKPDEMYGLTLYLTLDNRIFTIPTKAKVAHISEIAGRKKVGMFFVDVTPDDRDRILRYITKRQREIIRGLKL